MSGNRTPLVYLEAAFGIPPLTRPDPGDWVRIGLARSLSTSRGARIKTGEFETGEASVVVDDPDGVLDPSNTASPYAPDVLPRTRVRFVVAHNGGEDVIWTGFIKRLPVSWRSAVAITTVGAAGLLWLLASGPDLPPSVLEYETKQLEPLAYWPLTETSGRDVRDAVGVNDGEYMVEAAAVDSGPLLPYSPSTYRTFGNPSPSASDRVFAGQWADIRSFAPSTAAFSVAATIRMEAQSSGDWPIIFYAMAEDDWIIILRVVNVGVVMNVGTLAGTTIVDQATAVAESAAVIAGEVVRVVGTFDGTTARLYINGVQVPQAAGYAGLEVEAMSPGGDAMNARIGRSLRDSPEIYPGELRIGEVPYWDRALTADEIAADYAAGANPWEGDTTGQRLGRILDVMGVDADDRDIDAGTQVVGPATLGGNPTEHLRKLAATEGGPVYEDAEGRLAFREKLANDPTVGHVFSDDPTGDSGSAVEPVDPDFSLDRVINVATVTLPSGTAQTARNATSVAKYGEISTSLETLHATPSGARAKAAQLVIRGANPRLVFPRVVANHIDTDAAVLTDTDIGDAVSVIARPPRGGDPISQTSIVERIEHRLDRGWKTEFGVVEHLVLPTFYWDEPGQGWDESVWAPL